MTFISFFVSSKIDFVPLVISFTFLVAQAPTFARPIGLPVARGRAAPRAHFVKFFRPSLIFFASALTRLQARLATCFAFAMILEGLRALATRLIRLQILRGLNRLSQPRRRNHRRRLRPPQPVPVLTSSNAASASPVRGELPTQRMVQTMVAGKKLVRDASNFWLCKPLYMPRAVTTVTTGPSSPRMWPFNASSSACPSVSPFDISIAKASSCTSASLYASTCA